MYVSVIKVGLKLLLVKASSVAPINLPKKKYISNKPMLYQAISATEMWQYVGKFPKLGVTLDPYISKMVSHTKKPLRVQTTIGCSTIRCNAQICCSARLTLNEARCNTWPRPQAHSTTNLHYDNHCQFRLLTQESYYITLH